MKILILSDIHNQKIALQNILLKEYKKVDACFISGDITNFDSEDELNNILQTVTEYISDTYFVLGNCDPFLEHANIKYGINVENRKIILSNFILVGLSTKIEQKSINILSNLQANNSNVIILSHYPPYGTMVDLVSYNRHGGSKKLRKILDNYTCINFLICGHVHDSANIDSYQDVLIMNPGAVNTGNYGIISIDGNSKIEGELKNIYE